MAKSFPTMAMMLSTMIVCSTAATVKMEAPQYSTKEISTLGSIKECSTYKSGALLTTTSGNDVRVIFYGSNTVRVWVGWNGNFTEAKDMVIGEVDPSTPEPTISNKATECVIAGKGVVVTVNKSPASFSMMTAESVPLWKESSPLSWSKALMSQQLATSETEYFFGGGMINGQFSHKGDRITISTSNDWADGGNSNSAPFYMSTAGYGVFRNTWAPGNYDFRSNTTIAVDHNDTTFDTFYFAGSFQEILQQYTSITGTPFMIPIYGLGLGDSDCYHNGRHGNSTQTVLAVADKYREENMPGAWFLSNDGYGCGFGEGPSVFPSNFTDLDLVVAELHKKGFYAGLWSSTGLPNITREVAGSGVRIGKTDVGWIGRGYEYAFDSVKLVSDGIENNSNGRRFIWTVDGWAGTQRYAVMWTGDDYGSWDFIRWQIPTFVGASFSSQAHVSGDVDGIFGGSPDTYTRDLQFKCLMTAMMTMSGWASNPDKQPWTFGEPYTSINRMYLKLKMRLTPYFYSYSRVAHMTGMPPVRAMALQYPEDTATFVNATGTAYQFMAGDWFLVAPVYENATQRSGIYLPAGEWIDYWSGTVYTGPMTLDNYAAPLDTLPLFVLTGAIIPMWPDMLFFDEKAHDPITLDIYPNFNTSTKFVMYEDDGVTREHESGKFAETKISCDVGKMKSKKATPAINITIGATVGSYTGMLTTRGYTVKVHMPRTPKEVLLNNNSLTKFNSLASLDYAASGWFFNKINNQPVVHIKIPKSDVTKEQIISLTNGANFEHMCLAKCDLGSPQVFTYSSTTKQIVHNSGGLCATFSDDADPDSGTPAVELQPCKDQEGSQMWTYNADMNLVSGKRCMDQDRSDNSVEMYGCGKKQINQQWTLTADVRGPIKQAGSDKLCMQPCTESIPRTGPDALFRKKYEL